VDALLSFRNGGPCLCQRRFQLAGLLQGEIAFELSGNNTLFTSEIREAILCAAETLAESLGLTIEEAELARVPMYL
jgi:hypothetical protein